jgi:hypothetical protein
MEIRFHHTLEYRFEGPASVEDIISSLSANEVLLHGAVKVLERVIPGLSLEAGTVTVSEVIKRSPLKEYFAFAVLMTYQEDLKREVPPLIEKLSGVTIPDQYDTLITVLVMLLALYAISTIVERLTGKRPETIRDEKERLIHVAGDFINCRPEELDTAMTERVQGPARRQTESAARRFFRPVKGRPNTGIHASEERYSISSDAIAEVPSEAIVATLDEDSRIRTEFYQDVTIELHASDRDRPKLGWAGVARGITQNRVKMILDEGVSPEALFGKRIVRGDILMVHVQQPDGTDVEKEFHLIRLTSPTRSQR